MSETAFITKILKLNQPYEFSYNQINTLFSGKTPTIIYIPEAPLTGKNFVNRFRKKGIINEVLIPQMFILNGRKINMLNYIKDFKALNTNVKVNYKFKTQLKNKINIIDLTGLVELFYMTMKYKSKFKAITDFFNYTKELLKDNNIENDIYFFYEGTSQNYIILELIGRLALRKGMKLDSDFMNCDALIAYEDLGNQFKLYPILTKTIESNNTFYQFKYPLFKLYSQTVFEEGIIEDEHKVDNKETIKKEVLQLSEKILKSETASNKLIKDTEKRTGITDLMNSDNQTIDEIYNKVVQLNPDKSFEENLNELTKDVSPKEKEIIKKLIEYVNTINDKYNGVIKLNKDALNKTSNIYYDPIKVTNLDSLNVYNKVSTEFDTVLDNAMFDLIKSIEKDKDVNLKIEKMSTEIIDTNKSRYKEYIIKLKAPSEKPYSVKFRVPYPIKDKYMKIDGNTYIMINQFYPKPIMKIKPSIVRFYTHYSTLTCVLKNHKINEDQGLDGIIREVANLTKTKVEYIEDTNKINQIKDKFGLSEFPTIKVEIK